MAGPASDGCVGPHNGRGRWNHEAVTPVSKGRRWHQRVDDKEDGNEGGHESSPHRRTATVSSGADNPKLVVGRMQDVEYGPPEICGTERLDEISHDACIVGPIAV